MELSKKSLPLENLSKTIEKKEEYFDEKQTNVSIKACNNLIMKN